MKIDWQGQRKETAEEILILGPEHEKASIRLPISAGTNIDSGYADCSRAGTADSSTP